MSPDEGGVCVACFGQNFKPPRRRRGGLKKESEKTTLGELEGGKERGMRLHGLIFRCDFDATLCGCDLCQCDLVPMRLRQANCQA